MVRNSCALAAKSLSLGLFVFSGGSNPTQQLKNMLALFEHERNRPFFSSARANRPQWSDRVFGVWFDLPLHYCVRLYPNTTRSYVEIADNSSGRANRSAEDEDQASYSCEPTDNQPESG